MKLAKKMLVSVLALAMVAALALTAFAAAPTLNMTASEAIVGKTVTVTLSAAGMTGLEAADLEFSYDTEVLEFVSIAKAEGAAYDMGVGDKVADGKATWSIIYSEAAAADTGLVVLTFKVAKAGDATVSVAVGSWDGTDEPAGASVVVKAKEAASDPTPVDPTPEEPGTGTDEPVKPTPEVPKTGDAGVAVIAGVMALAAVAFVATRKKDEE